MHGTKCCAVTKRPFYDVHHNKLCVESLSGKCIKNALSRYTGIDDVDTGKNV